MKKFIYLLDAIELLKRLINGKRVQGVLFIDENTGRLTFKPYYSRGQHNVRNWLIRRLEHGWVKESAERIKVYKSVPKELGTAKVISIMDREHQCAMDALIDRELGLSE